jgi:hypothetical protein
MKPTELQVGVGVGYMGVCVLGGGGVVTQELYRCHASGAAALLPV